MKTIHIVSHTHWDREWYRTFQAFRMRLVETLDAILEIMSSSNEYRHFTLDGQIIILEDYLELRPEQRQRIMQLVQQGRLHIGPWYVLADEFLVSGEALIRNLQEGKRSGQAFGPLMHIGYIPDPFGHIGQMPQILQGFGISSACLQRGLDDHPCELWWESADGSRVLLSYLRDGYGNAAHLPMHALESFIKEAVQVAQALEPHSSSDHLLLMQGTDHMPPQKDSGVIIAKANPNSQGYLLIHSCLEDYFAGLTDLIRDPTAHDLPVVRGELRASKRHHLLPGVLSTRMWIKQRNHGCQTLLEKWVEPCSVFATHFISPQPETSTLISGALYAPFIRYAWRLLMQCHPHDSICGCSLDQVHNEMRTRFDQVEQVGRELVERFLRHLAVQINTSPPPLSAGMSGEVLCAVIVFNRAPTQMSGLVSFQIPVPIAEETLYLLDENGQHTEVEIVARHVQTLIDQRMDREAFFTLANRLNDGQVSGLPIPETGLFRLQVQRGQGDDLEVFVTLHDPTELQNSTPDIAQAGLSLLAEAGIQRIHLRTLKGQTALEFVAREVPPLGYKTYWLIKGSRKPLKRRTLKLLSHDWRISNQFIELFYDERNGVLSLLDKISQTLYPNINQFIDGGDCGDTYNYAPPEQDEWVHAKLIGARMNAHQAYTRVELRYEMHLPRALTTDRQRRSAQKSTMRIRSLVTIWQHTPMLEFHTTLENRAKDHRLRVHFLTPVDASTAFYDGNFEIVERPIGVPTYDESWVEEPRPEQPQQAFSYIKDACKGLILANKGLPEIEIYPSEQGLGMALTLLRCIGWLSRNDCSTRRGHAGPELPLPEAQMPGTWSFEYALIPFDSDRFLASLQQAYAYSQPLKATSSGIRHTGILPPHASFVRISPPSFILSAIKLAEDGRGFILRGYNIAKERIETRISFMRRFNKAYLCNLAEEDLAALDILPDGSLTLVAEPGKIVTVRCCT